MEVDTASPRPSATPPLQGGGDLVSTTPEDDDVVSPAATLVTPTTTPTPTTTSAKTLGRLSPLCLSATPAMAATTPHSPSADQLRSLIVSYLIHNCYEKTAYAILQTDGDVRMRDDDVDEKDKGNDNDKDSDMHVEAATDNLDGIVHTHALGKRRRIMQYIQRGEIEAALTLTDKTMRQRGATSKEKESNDDTLSSRFPHTYARALCQNFAELIRQDENFNALLYARSKIVPFGKKFDEALVLVRRYLPLLAYAEPQLSPVFELVDIDRREWLADEVNGCVVTWLSGGEANACTQSVLERMLRQLILVKRKLHNNKWCLDDGLQSIGGTGSTTNTNGGSRGKTE